VAFPSPAPDLVTLRHSGQADQAAALVYWPTPDGTDKVLARKLSLLAEVLQIRVIEEVREELGATYSPSIGGNFSRDFPGYGYISIRMEVKTEDVNDLFEVADEIAADFAAGNITQDQFDRALRPLLAGIDENQEQNGYWMSVAAQAQTVPENLDRHRTQRADYEAITLDDIKALAAEYLTPENALRIQVLPQDVAAAGGQTPAP
jgi:zinc protease